MDVPSYILEFYGWFKLLNVVLFQSIASVKCSVFYRSGPLHVLFISPFFFRILSNMYRTTDDLLLKCTRQSGPPFFDLRESISMIFNGFMRESKVCDRKISFS